MLAAHSRKTKKEAIDNGSCHHCRQRPSSIFLNASEETFRMMELNNICNEYRKGQVIFAQGNRPMGLYFIDHGKVKMIRRTDGQRDQILQFAKDEDILGYRALLGGVNYQTTAIAIEDCSVCFIPRDTFLQLMGKDANLNLTLVRKLCRDADMDEDKIINMSQRPVRERAALALLSFQELCGNGIIDVELTREEMASYAGTVKETMVRLLTEFKQAQIIEVEEEDCHRIKIINEEKLRRTAGL